MTPGELPADMEGLVHALDAVEKIGAKEENLLRAALLFDAVNRSRALLKAYQEQRRALEEARSIVFDATMEDRYPSLAVEILAQIDAALNQKGDER